LIFALAGFTDWLDGYLARSWQQSTRFGEFLDPVADKLMVVVALVLPVALNFLGVLYINLEGLWPDGRLLFETIGLAAILFMAGQQAFMRLIKQENKAGHQRHNGRKCFN